MDRFLHGLKEIEQKSWLSKCTTQLILHILETFIYLSLQLLQECV